MWKTAGITFGSKLLSALLLFLLWIFISRHLGPAERGICSLYLLVISIIIVISDMAGGAAAAFLLQTIPAKSIGILQMKWCLVPAILVPLLFALFGKLTLSDAAIVGLIGWVHASWMMQQHIWLGEKQFRFFNLMNALAPLLIIIFFGIVWFGFERQTRYAYLTGLGLAWFLVLAISSFRFWKRHADVDSEATSSSVKQIFKRGGMNQLAHLASLANNRWVFFMLPATSLGVFANAQSISEAILMVPGSLGQIYYALAADKSVGRNELSKTLKINVLLMTLGCATLIILPESFWLYLFGPSFRGIRQLLIWLTPGIWFYSFYLIFSYWQSANGRFQRNLQVLLLGIVIQAIIFVFAHFYHLIDVKMATVSLSASWVVLSLSSLAIFLFKTEKE
jgi:O-antigen/teichoic acid export membrane protein